MRVPKKSQFFLFCFWLDFLGETFARHFTLDILYFWLFKGGDGGIYLYVFLEFCCTAGSSSPCFLFLLRSFRGYALAAPGAYFFNDGVLVG